LGDAARPEGFTRRNLLLITLILLLSSLVFFAASVYTLSANKPLQSLLSFIIGIILLGSSLAIIKEGLEGSSS
jgi:uncharacterized membrane-anchored protein